MRNNKTDNSYPFDNEIVVEIEGKQHKSWKSYEIDSDFLIPADSFSFNIGLPAESTQIPNYTGKTAKVLINDELVLTGIIDTTRHNISKGNRTFLLNGRDKAAILLDCSAPQINVKGLTVLQAIEQIVKPLGVTNVQLKAESNPILDKVDINVGESAWQAIMNCANSAGLHCWFEPDGVLIVGGADYSTPPVATLCCNKSGDKNNVLEASLMFDYSQSYSHITFLAQRHGRSNDESKHDLKWVYEAENAPSYKPKTIVIADVENLEALQKKAKKFISDSLLEQFDLTLIVADHKTASGELWRPGQRVHVICEEYGIDAIFFLMGRRFMLTKFGGTQTELRLKEDGVWTPDAYAAKSEKARKRKGKGKLLVSDGQGGWK